MATTQVSGPGKTAPKLLADFLQFDPQKNVGGNSNILIGHPPAVGEGQGPKPHGDACKYEYTIKANQSVTPPLDSRPDASTQYKLAVICKRCRLHVDIRISYQQAIDPCPTSESQLHHFQRAPGLDDNGSAHIRYGWQCSSATCQALLTTTFKLGKITSADKNLLTDTGKLKSRFEAVMQDDPEREGIRQATPVEALTRLRKYIRDALNPEHDKRVFPANNKRFMEAYGLHGRDCQDFLQRLGFQFNEEDMNWTLPNPAQISDRLSATGDSLREYLEDVEMELLALAWRTAAEMNVVSPVAGEGWPSAQRDLERILATQGYARLTSLRRTNVANELEQYFASLGAISDFSDSLIDFAYERQTKCDALSEPYYYECIQSIAKQRGSEELQLKTTMLESKGLVSRRDLSEAYRYFNLPSDGGAADDDRIFNLFQAQHTDLGRQGQEQARNMLGRIGRQRGSKRLTNASQQTIETMEEAYEWLGGGLGPAADDSFVVTIFSVRTDGNKDLEDIGRKAVSIIARERKSNYLNNWLAGDDTNQTTMNVDEALRLLGVDTRLEDIEATIWPTIFQSARDDKPGEQTEQAIAAVQGALAGPSTAMNPMRAPDTWPVGLVSHGNTCYLNSLLQYYFSLKPLRDIVLNYEQYKLDEAAGKEKSVRVGQTYVSTLEIQDGQNFAEELRHLFERMVRDRGNAVKPEQDLVCRAFLEPKDFAELEAQRDANDSAIDDSGTLPDLVTNGNVEAKEPGAGQSRASSETLQADDHGQNDNTGDVRMNGSDMPPTPPTSPGQKPADRQANGQAPPPLPPRRFSTTTRTTLERAEAKAKQQQDVTEVHDSITQRLRAGMQPQGKDARAEQFDALREIYAIVMSQTALSETSTSQPARISDFSIQLNVPSEPSDLYSALDAYFDPQPVTEGSEKLQYRSIVELPPLVQINMPRIGFNKETSQAYKSDVALRLEDELYLDRYCEGAVMDRRRSAWGWRKKLLELKKEQKALKGTEIGLDGPAAVSETAKYIKRLEDVNADLEALGEEPIETDSEVPAALEADAVSQKERLQSLDLEVTKLQGKLTGTFDDLKEKKYRLYAVFFHRGGSSSGHYWISIHDFKKDIWRSYNDESVTEVTNLQEIFYANEWQHGTPTYAVYVRDDLKETYVQPVCRELEDAPPPPEPSEWDVNMPDAAAQDNNNNPGTVHGKSPETVKEGGSAWDAGREVPDATCQVPELAPDHETGYVSGLTLGSAESQSTAPSSASLSTPSATSQPQTHFLQAPKPSAPQRVRNPRTPNLSPAEVQASSLAFEQATRARGTIITTTTITTTRSTAAQPPRDSDDPPMSDFNLRAFSPDRNGKRVGSSGTGKGTPPKRQVRSPES